MERRNEFCKRMAELVENEFEELYPFLYFDSADISERDSDKTVVYLSVPLTGNQLNMLYHTDEMYDQMLGEYIQYANGYGREMRDCVTKGLPKRMANDVLKNLTFNHMVNWEFDNGSVVLMNFIAEIDFGSNTILFKSDIIPSVGMAFASSPNQTVIWKPDDEKDDVLSKSQSVILEKAKEAIKETMLFWHPANRLV